MKDDDLNLNSDITKRNLREYHPGKFIGGRNIGGD